MVINKSDRVFQFFNGLFLAICSLTMLAPLIHLAAISFSSAAYAEAKLVYFWPKGFNVHVYETIFGMEKLWRSLGVTVYIVVVGTLISMFFVSTLSYSLSRPGSPGKKWILRMILITFVFQAPLIPHYLLIRSLGMDNTLWALMIPNALGAFAVIIMKTFFQAISSEIFDAARIDGCSEYAIYARIAIPLSTAVIATLSLFHAVALWNNYFQALIFIRDKNLYPLQLLLRSLIVEEQGAFQEMDMDMSNATTPEMMKAGIILFATIPILIVYPFLQKYFVKGAMLGSLKE